MSEHARACRLRLWRERAGIDAGTVAALLDMPESEYVRCESGQRTMWLADREALRYLFDDLYGAGFLLGASQGEQLQRELDGMDAAFHATMGRLAVRLGS